MGDMGEHGEVGTRPLPGALPPNSLCAVCPNVRLLGFRSIDEELERIELAAVDEDFVVQVVAGGAAGGAGEADEIAALHLIAGLDARIATGARSASRSRSRG